MRIHYSNVNTIKLHGELISRGIQPILVENDAKEQEIANNTYITFADDTDMQLVQSVLDAHNPITIPTISPDDVLNAKIEVQTINTLIDLGVI